MKWHRYYIVDVFAEKKYEGNQLAVFRDAGDLSAEKMQTIAREMHFSETTFILSDSMKDGAHEVRIFTPEEEVPFAGHPTLGTAFIVNTEVYPMAAREVMLDLKVGRIPVQMLAGPDGVHWMKQNEPEFGAECSAEDIAPILRISPDDIDKQYPVMEVSTGLPFIIVPLKSLATLSGIRVDTGKLLEFVKDKKAKSILVFCPETRDKQNKLSVRVFTDYYGIPEDPATGSANGCLAAYLARFKYFGSSEVDIKVEQGHEVKRPSLLYLRAKDNVSSVEVLVGGKVKMVAKAILME